MTMTPSCDLRQLLLNVLLLIVGGQCKSILEMEPDEGQDFDKPLIQNDNCTGIRRMQLLGTLLSRINRKMHLFTQPLDSSRRNATFVGASGCGEEDGGYFDDATPSAWPIAIGLTIFGLAVGAVALGVIVTKRRQAGRQRLL